MDTVVTSPPYNLGIKYNEYKDAKPDSEFFPFMREVWVEVNRKLMEDGHFFLQVGGTATKPLIPWQFLQGTLDAGFQLQNEIIWAKSIAVDGKTYGPFKPLNSPRFLNHTHEFIFHLTKTGKVPVDKLAIGVPFKWKSNIERFKTNNGNDVRCRGNVWHIPYDTVRSKDDKFNHPAIFPVALPRTCIQFSGIPKGSLVVDPFVGSGTTLVACAELGMNAIGFETDAKYVAVANERLSKSDARSAVGQREGDRRSCTCGSEWNTFDTGGVCPACVYQ